MPRSIEGITACHEAATERRRTGQPVWDHHIPVGTILRDEEMMFEQKRDAIVSLVRGSRWYRTAEEFSPLPEIMDEMKDAEDVDHFDDVLDNLYDEADADRVWLSS